MSKSCPRRWSRAQVCSWPLRDRQRASDDGRSALRSAVVGGALLAASGCSGDLDGQGFPVLGPTAATVASSNVNPSATTSTPLAADPSSSLAPSQTVTPSGTLVPVATSGAGGAVGAGGSAGDAGGASAGGSEGGLGGAPVDPAILQAAPVRALRLLTQIEYRNSVSRLLQGVDTTTLELPDDNPVAGFGTVGASTLTISETSAEAYEAAARAVTLEVFSDPERWGALVGCEPAPDLSDACVETYVTSFGRKAFRRELAEEEVLQWTEVARNAATLSEDAATGLATATWGILQSPNFLYRFEHAEPDIELGRIKFDGASIATRLAYLATGGPPEEWLLDAAAAGQLDTGEGVRSAAEQLLAQEDSAEFIPEFFIELTELWQVLQVERDPELFPGVDDLRASMLEETRRWLGEVVVAPEADVRSFFDSRTTFVDAPLAEFYGLSTPGGGEQGGGFWEVELPAETGRAGILGKAGFLMAHSSPDSTNPTRRGKFILHQFNCMKVPPPPADLMVSIPKTPEGGEPKTTRQLFEEQHRVDTTCVTCHALMDPFGFALEHFDAVGRYRETENGLPIDTTGEFMGTPFADAVELGGVLREMDETTRCFIESLYRYANGSVDGGATDAVLIDGLMGTFAERNYVWRDLLVDFAASDAFTSLPPTTVENQ